MSIYTATREIENETPSPWFDLPYSPARKEGIEATGIRRFSVEGLLTSCGSGSLYDAAFSDLRNHLSHSRIFGDWIVLHLNSQGETEQLSPFTVGEKLDRIRNAFGISMSALAEILRSSRASVYNWYEIEPRSADIIQRIESLYEIAQQWPAMNPYHYTPGKLMKQKLGDGPSMLERLGRDALDRDEIQAGLVSLLALMQKQRERMDRAKASAADTPIDDESRRELLERLTGSVTADK